MKKIKCDICKTIHGGFHLCWNPEDGPKLIRSSENMKSKIEVLKKYNFNSETARRTTEERWAKFREETRERDLEILKLYEAGMGTAALAKRYGIAKVTVARTVERMGGKLRPKGHNYRFKEQA